MPPASGQRGPAAGRGGPGRRVPGAGRCPPRPRAAILCAPGPGLAWPGGAAPGAAPCPATSLRARGGPEAPPGASGWGWGGGRGRALRPCRGGFVSGVTGTALGKRSGGFACAVLGRRCAPAGSRLSITSDYFFSITAFSA